MVDASSIAAAAASVFLLAACVFILMLNVTMLRDIEQRIEHIEELVGR